MFYFKGNIPYKLLNNDTGDTNLETTHWRRKLLPGGESWTIYFRQLFQTLFGTRKIFKNFSFQLRFLKIQLFFSILILLSITLKQWNFLDHYDFKGNKWLTKNK